MWQTPRAGGPAPKTHRSWLWCWVSAHDPEPWRRAPRTPARPRPCSPRHLCWSSGCGAWRLAPGVPGTAPHLRGRTDSGSGPASAPPLLLERHSSWAEGWKGIGRCSVAWTSYWSGRRPVCRDAAQGSAPACSGASLSRDEASPLGSPGFLLVKGRGGGPRPPLTLDLVVRWQEADVREGDPPGVPVVELHGDEVPVIFQAQQACWRTEGSGEAHRPGPPADAGQRGADTRH